MSTHSMCYISRRFKHSRGYHSTKTGNDTNKTIHCLSVLFIICNSLISFVLRAFKILLYKFSSVLRHLCTNVPWFISLQCFFACFMMYLSAMRLRGVDETAGMWKELSLAYFNRVLSENTKCMFIYRRHVTKVCPTI